MNPTEQEVFLKVERINTYYGKSHILFDVSLEVEKPGDVVCLIGRNGAGKTTTLRSIVGWTAPRKGSVQFRGTEIAGQSAHQITRLGIGIVPEDRRIFADLTVGENLKLGSRLSTRRGRTMIWKEEGIFGIFPILKEFYTRRGGDLSGGQQQMLSIARTLLMNPDLLLLDEPAEGLAPIIVKELGIQLLKVKEEGLTMILTEQQHLDFMMKLGDYGYIIDKGEIKYHAPLGEIKDNEEIKLKFLAV
jgi:branched-chain amino acid transport system ATP-binding protein